MRRRFHGLDTLRGLTLVSMMAYHACWDLVHLWGWDWGWYRGEGAYLWQQSICWTFILLSGYCFFMGRAPWKRGVTALLGGVAVTLVTMAVLPESPALFGVLTFLGGAMLISALLRTMLLRVEPRLGLTVSFGLFLLLREVNGGFLGFEGVHLLALPQGWYQDLMTAWMGFPPDGFASSDYFPVLPWLLLFWTGAFLYRLHPGERREGLRLPLVTDMGRHSLMIYLLHQPVICGALTLALG